MIAADVHTCCVMNLMRNHKKNRLTDRCREEGKAHDGGQSGEHGLATQLLLEPSSELNLDAACRVGSVPVALRSCRLAPSGPD